MLPNVSIDFKNGALGAVSPSADGVVGLLIISEYSGSYEKDKAYCLFRSSSLSEDVPNETKQIVDAFYAESGEGAELWLYFTSQDYASSILPFAQQAGGRLRAVAVCERENTDGGDDFLTTLQAYQTAAEKVTDLLKAPIVVVCHGTYSDDAEDLSGASYDRVAVLVGDDAENDANLPLLGCLMGRIAASAVQTHIGRVKDGALSIASCKIDGKSVEAQQDAVEILNNKGYIVPRTYVGKSGLYFADDHMACDVKSDYHSLARRRVIDKAYRCTYECLLEYVNDNMDVTSEGHITAIAAKGIEQELEQYIYNAMTSEGNLSVDGTDSTDRGVKVSVDTENDFVATNRLNVTVSVKPYGYAKYISVELGFIKE